MAMKIRLKMKDRLHRYDTNRSRPRDRQTYSKYKICLSTVMVICIKQDLKLNS